MTNRNQVEIGTDELDWEHAEVREGRAHGVVVSVRLDADEAARLRHLAATLGLNMSQVLRQGLADFDPGRERQLLSSRAFTFGGVDWIGTIAVEPPPQGESRTELQPRIREVLPG